MGIKNPFSRQRFKFNLARIRENGFLDRLAFDTGARNAFGEIFLREKVEDDDGQNDECRKCHHPLRLRAAIGSVELLETDGEHAHVAIARDQKGPFEIVP